MLLQLFLSFFKIGALTFGGGYAMLPMMQRELVDNRAWISEQELTDVYALSQCTPGPIAINTATYIGNKQKGTLGGILATLGVITPSLIIILAIAALFDGISSNKYFLWALAGVSAAVCGLVLCAFIRMVGRNVKKAMGIIICIISFALVFFFKVSPIIIIAAAGVVGAVVPLIGRREKK